MPPVLGTCKQDCVRKWRRSPVRGQFVRSVVLWQQSVPVDRPVSCDSFIGKTLLHVRETRMAGAGFEPATLGL